MSRSPIPLALLSAIVLMAAAAPARAEVRLPKDWQVLESPNFRVMGDAGQRKLKEVARQLEQFREAIGVLFPKAVVSSPAPTTVLVFRSHKSYEPFKPQYQGTAVKHVAGYFLPGEAGNYITLTTEGGVDLGIIYHEYVHMLVNGLLTGVPAWFNEGLAEYYRTFAIAGGRDASLGRIIDHHVLRLRSEFIPLEVLAQVDRGSPLYNESDKASVFYAESWALVHYLMIGNEQRYQPRVTKFVAALVSGVPFERACSEALGVTIEKLERELRAYVRQTMFHSVRVSFTERIGKIDGLAATPLSLVDAHAALGELLLRMGRADEARQHLERAVALDPHSSAAHASLGMMYVRTGDFANARDHLRRAVASPGASFLSHYYHAWALSRAADASSAGTAGDESGAIETSLRKSIALNPSFADAYAQLGRHLSRQSDRAKEATQLMRKAIELLPGREEYILTYAGLLANQEDFAGARPLAAHLASRAKNESVRAAAGQLLGYLEDHERRTAEWKATGAGRDDAVGLPVDTPGRAGYQLAFRQLSDGEARLFGRLTGIECTRAGVVVTVESDGKLLKPIAPDFGRIDFVSFRSDLTGEIKCGPRAEPVMLVYRPDPADRSRGTVVAIEFVPLDYVPR
jgi:tetratricopeptide (TPR) repeat protein